MSEKFVVGVTGGIGAGKSAATAMFESLGITVVDADVVAREVVQPGKPALKAINEAFGSEVLLADGELNRPRLREIIFSDEASKTRLNEIMFPAIRNALLHQLTAAESAYVILSAPLLLENDLQVYTDRVLVVDVPEHMQLSRASARDAVDLEQIQNIINSQIPRQQRLAKADDVLDNSQTLADLQQQVLLLHQEYLKLAGDK